ncbi:hypothetical protein BJ508DRAFT_26115 [Ascobolus immersus RN42]|uniref:Uncharacterized protein n=1 Tax=Ascobolus immersus RN42 TaxID=1160509 RepID=A0A3N4IF04_ASCIM|nr:hypothetical protein BJ508DRAFT_26115 [Ascobolus immersus RN42]
MRESGVKCNARECVEAPHGKVTIRIVCENPSESLHASVNWKQHGSSTEEDENVRWNMEVKEQSVVYVEASGGNRLDGCAENKPNVPEIETTQGSKPASSIWCIGSTCRLVGVCTTGSGVLVPVLPETPQLLPATMLLPLFHLRCPTISPTR